jgi:Arc/MetJ-type ribon-helix-helix transcriptional regulator
LAEAVERLESAAKAKGDKLVRYTVELLKSEEAAIEALRAELSKAAGWAASKSDILRAGVRLFAEQRLEQMKELLTALAAPAKGKKKG